MLKKKVHILWHITNNMFSMTLLPYSLISIHLRNLLVSVKTSPIWEVFQSLGASIYVFFIAISFFCKIRRVMKTQLVYAAELPCAHDSPASAEEPAETLLPLVDSGPRQRLIVALIVLKAFLRHHQRHLVQARGLILQGVSVAWRWENVFKHVTI